MAKNDFALAFNEVLEEINNYNGNTIISKIVYYFNNFWFDFSSGLLVSISTPHNDPEGLAGIVN